MDSADGGNDISAVEEEHIVSPAGVRKLSHEGDMNTETAAYDVLRLAMQHGGRGPEASKDFFVKAGAVYGTIAGILNRDLQKNREQTSDKKA